MASHDVFISYKSEDDAEASWLKQILEKNGIHCRIAPDDIPMWPRFLLAVRLFHLIVTP